MYENSANYASLYLDASRTTDDAAELVALRWRAAREQLAGDGADYTTLGALEELVTGQGHSVPGLAAFAREGEVAFAAAPPRPPAGRSAGTRGCRATSTHITRLSQR